MDNNLLCLVERTQSSTRGGGARSTGCCALGSLLDATVVFVVAAELEALDVVPIVDAMVDPGGNFGVIQFGAVEGGINVGAEVGVENRKSFVDERVSRNRFEERVDLILGVKPAVFQTWPG